MRNWLMQPSKIPNAPSWGTVFLFGAVWNAVITHCWWAVAFCLGVYVLLPALDVADRRFFRYVLVERHRPRR